MRTKILSGLLVVLLFVTISDAAAHASDIYVGEAIGYVYSSDILVTINGVPIPSVNIGTATAIAVEDLAHYWFNVRFSSTFQRFEVWTHADRFLHHRWPGLPTERGERSAVDEDGNYIPIGKFYSTDVGVWIDTITIPSFIVNGRVHVAVEDSSHFVPSMSHVWDEEYRVLDLIVGVSTYPASGWHWPSLWRFPVTIEEGFFVYTERYEFTGDYGDGLSPYEAARRAVELWLQLRARDDTIPPELWSEHSPPRDRFRATNNMPFDVVLVWVRSFSVAPLYHHYHFRIYTVNGEFVTAITVTTQGQPPQTARYFPLF